MKLNLIEDEKESLVIEFEGVDRGIPDLIKSKLLDNKDVNFASVVKEHFEVSKPRLVVKSEKNAKTLVLKAIEDLEDELKELQSQVPKK
jgi:DNA-directed RNA polymerase subunit L